MKATASKRPADQAAPVPSVTELISFQSFAAQAGVSYATLVNWTKRPRSPLVYWKVGGKRFTTQAAFSAFVAAGQAGSNGPK